MTSAANCTNSATLTAECTEKRPPGCECGGYPNACDCPVWFLGAGLPYTVVVLVLVGCCCVAAAIYSKRQAREATEAASAGSDK